jgi:hypothetical protein
MRKPVIVDSPYPTVWETAETMGVSKKRTKELIKMASEVLAHRERKHKTDQNAKRKQLKTA